MYGRIRELHALNDAFPNRLWSEQPDRGEFRQAKRPEFGTTEPEIGQSEQRIAILAQFGREPRRRTDRRKEFVNRHEVRLHRTRHHGSTPRLVIRTQGGIQFSGPELAPITAFVGLSHVILHSCPLTIRPPAARGWAASTPCRPRPGRWPAPERSEGRR